MLRAGTSLQRARPVARPFHAVQHQGQKGEGRTAMCRPAGEGDEVHVNPTKGRAVQGPRGLRGGSCRQREGPTCRLTSLGLFARFRWPYPARLRPSSVYGRRFNVELIKEAWHKMENWAFVSRKQRGSDKGWGRTVKGSWVPLRPLSTSLLTPKCRAWRGPHKQRQQVSSSGLGSHK